MTEELASVGSGLKISNPKASEWMYFRELNGAGSGGVMRFRIPDHGAELILKRKFTEEDELRRVHRDDPIPGAEVIPRGRTELALRKPTPTFDPGRPAQDQRVQLRGAIEVLGELRDWYVRHGRNLVSEG